jgi:hypothetical protein
MQCDDFRAELSRSKDQRQPMSTDAMRHLDACSRCQAYRDELTRLEDQLRAEIGPEPSMRPELRERILSAVHATPAPTTGNRRRLFLGAAGLAAAACVAMVIVLQPPRENPRPAPGNSEEVAALSDLLPAGDLGQALTEVATRPLRREADRLAKDVRATGRGLLACLPLELISSHWNSERPRLPRPVTSQAAGEG